MITPPTSLELAKAAWDSAKTEKRGAPHPHDVWLVAHSLWWGWWVDAVVAERGPEYLDSLSTGGWPGEQDRLLADYPQAAFPWATREELEGYLPHESPRSSPGQVTQLTLFDDGEKPR